MSDLKHRPWADGCIFNPQGIVCKEPMGHCPSCGWCPAEEKRRLLALQARIDAAKEAAADAERARRKRRGR